MKNAGALTLTILAIFFFAMGTLTHGASIKFGLGSLVLAGWSLWRRQSVK